MEEANLLFMSDIPFFQRNFEEYNRGATAVGGNTAVAARRLMEEVHGTVTTDEETLEKHSKLKMEDLEVCK